MAAQTRQARIMFLNLAFCDVSRPGTIGDGVSIEGEANIFYLLVNLVLKHFNVCTLFLCLKDLISERFFRVFKPLFK